MTTAHLVAVGMGGRDVLGCDVRSDLDLDGVIRAGMSPGVIDAVLESGRVEPNELHELVLSRRALAYRRETRHRLTPDESNRVARVVRAIVRAEEALGSPEKAYRWMRRENRGLIGKRPIDLLHSEAGARAVDRVLGRIEHGIFS